MTNENDSSKKRDPDKTKKLLIDAIGKILITKGHAHLTSREIANTAGVDKKMIKYYFGSLNSLLKTYLHQKDFWMPVLPEPINPCQPKGHLYNALKEQFESLLQHAEMQRFIYWQLSEYHPVISSVAMLREQEAEYLLAKCKDRFKGNSVNLNAVVSVLIASIYAMVLQSNTGNGPICGIDISKDADQKIMLDTIRQILTWALAEAG